MTTGIHTVWTLDRTDFKPIVCPDANASGWPNAEREEKTMLMRFENLIPAGLLQEMQAKLATVAFQDGHLTAGVDARGVKQNLQLPPANPLARELGEAVVKTLLARGDVVRTLFPKRISPPLFAAYESGMEYGLHVDNALMGSPAGPLRGDISMTIFLSGPADYDGGELTIEDSGLGHHRIRLPAGSAVAYPSTSLHRVAPVTRGRRLVCVLWLQSQIRDPGQRRILVDLDLALGHLRTNADNTAARDLVAAAYNNLLRQWADV